jgi:hypothetical protein
MMRTMMKVWAPTLWTRSPTRPATYPTEIASKRGSRLTRSARRPWLNRSPMRTKKAVRPSRPVSMRTLGIWASTKEWPVTPQPMTG